VAVPMGAAKLIEAFQGAEGTDVFRGVLFVCRGERDLARANAAMAMAKKQERAYWCGAMRALEEMEERLMDLAARSPDGRAAGVKKTQGRGEGIRGGRCRR